MRADLHIHSTVSDSSMTIGEVIQAAVQAELDAIAITDHDTLSHRNQIPLQPVAYTDGRGEQRQLKVQAGIEISAYDYEKQFRVHVLGYRIAKPEIVEKLTLPTLEARHANSMKQIQILEAHGYHIDVSRVKKADGQYIYKQHIMDYLTETGQVPEMFGDFYYQTFKNGGICDFDICYADPKEAVRAIKDAGGLAVLAHSGQQQNFELIPGLWEAGLDGLELNHHANSQADHQIIRKYAEQYSLFLTGGSDSHGRYEPNSPAVGDYLAEESGAEKVVG